MSKEGFNKFIGVVVLLIVLTLIKRWFSYPYALVWLGVITGFYLPFVDNLFYAYVVRPEANISKNIRSLVSIRKIKQLVRYTNEVDGQQERSIIYSAYFQAVFLLLTYYILTSSGSLFGRGLVYGFSLRLLLEQVLQYMNTKELNKWFSEMSIVMDAHKTRVFLYANGLVLLVFTMML